ncbi:MAG: ABC transporter permease subunit [Burkholderiales bacterium]|nr:ABC transporter permease subunit [Burkholderiales bacterium]
MRTKVKKKLTGTDIALLLMLAPGLIWLFLLKYLPMGGVILAFKEFHFSRGGFFASIWDSSWVGLSNFKFLFASESAWIITRNTILYNLVFILLGTIFSILVAVALSLILNKTLAKIYQTCLFLPYFLTWVVVGYLLLSFLSFDKGTVNSILHWFNIKPIQWYDKASAWPYILTYVNLWKNVGYSAVIYLAAIIGIDRQYYEAAEIDGANKWQQLLSITLPHLKPLIIVMTLLALGRIFSADFGLFYQATLNSGALYPTTDVIDTYVFRGLMYTGDIGMSTAAGLYQSIIGFILILTVNKMVKKMDKDSSMF